MRIKINLKDGSVFNLKIKKIKSITIKKNKLKINYEKYDIIFENNLLDSFKIIIPSMITKFNLIFVSYSNTLTTILTNILHNSKKSSTLN